MWTSKLIAFYRGEGPDASGRMIDEVLSFSDSQLEDVHDYIQWLFPLRDRSAFNDSAPLLTTNDIVILCADSKASDNLVLSLARLLNFYGFEPAISRKRIKIVKSKSFNEKSHNWLTPYNHNFLRITRILKSLCLLGFREHANAFFKILEEVYKDNSKIIGEVSMAYWKEAIS